MKNLSIQFRLDNCGNSILKPHARISLRVVIVIVILFPWPELKYPKEKKSADCTFCVPPLPLLVISRESNRDDCTLINGLLRANPNKSDFFWKTHWPRLWQIVVFVAPERKYLPYIVVGGWGRWGRLCPQFAARNHLSLSPTSLHLENQVFLQPTQPLYPLPNANHPSKAL